MFHYMMMPLFPNINTEPPTLYSLMNSIVNYNNPNPVKISELSKNARTTIFNFDYPLSSKVTKEEFEVMILNKFMQRRIGFQTFTAWQLQLNVKLNEIMPLYNKLFDSLEGWDLFNDGEQVTRDVTDNRVIDGTSTQSGSGTTNQTSDKRYSELPQDNITNVQNGTYLTTYNYDTDTGTTTQTSSTTTKSDDKGNLKETIKRSPSDKIKIYQEFIQNKNNIYTMIYKDLDALFYQIV